MDNQKDMFGDFDAEDERLKKEIERLREERRRKQRDEGQRRKHDGMELAADNREPLLDRIRKIAVRVAREKRSPITMDDVREAYMEEGISADALGNAAGSVFIGKCWQKTGELESSSWPPNHGRDLRIWEYVGQ